MRLQKFLAHCGVCSRRKSEDIIKSGIVMVNGVVITNCAQKIDMERDVVKVNNKTIRPVKKIYIVLNKPVGCITSVSDEKNRTTVLDIIGSAIKRRIYPVGRLDYNTSGCLLLTNDGDWADRIIHPKYEIEKEYIVKVKGDWKDGVAQKLRKGLLIDGKKMFAKDIRFIRKLEKNYIISIIITQGINHQIKKMFSYTGMTVLRLSRERVGAVNIKGLPVGAWRYLTKKEIESF